MNVRVALQAGDSLTLAGISRLLRGRTEVSILPPAERALADVHVVACDNLAEPAGRELLAATAADRRPVVLIAGRIDDDDLAFAARSRVVSVLLREDATAERLHGQVRLAVARGVVPALLAETLLRDALFSGRVPLAAREREVLRLMADGLANAEIAIELASSERSVKKIAHRIFSRHRLRNRPHAVAYAVRSGLI
jgi:DNA-binding NarL/FixJ family response regulator